MRVIPHLKDNWKIDDQGDVKEQIRQRVNSEDNFTWARRYPLIKKVVKIRSKLLVDSII